MPLLVPASPAGGMPQLGFDDATTCFLADGLDLDCGAPPAAASAAAAAPAPAVAAAGPAAGPAAAAASIAGAGAGGATSAAVLPDVVMTDVTNGQPAPRHTTRCGGNARCGGARRGGVALLGRLLAPPVLEAVLQSPLAAPPAAAPPAAAPLAAADVLQLRLVVAAIATADDDAAAQEWLTPQLPQPQQQPQQPQQQQPQQPQQQQQTVTLTAPSAADAATLRRLAASLQPGHQLLLTGLQRGLSAAANADAASAGGFRGMLGGRAWTPAAIEGGGAAAVYNLSVCRAALRSTQLREVRPIASAARRRMLKRRTAAHSALRLGGTAARRHRRRRRPRGTGPSARGCAVALCWRGAALGTRCCSALGPREVSRE